MGETVPSQKQLRWAQLRVGLTVVLSALVLAVLVFLMSGTTGLFTPTLRLVSYVDNAGGLRTGAPVRLQSVDIGNVESIRIVNSSGGEWREYAGGDPDEGEREVPAVYPHRLPGVAHHGWGAGRDLHRY